jgi:hypothetical protein
MAISEQGWRQFLAADGVADWVVLHGAATAVFRVPSLNEPVPVTNFSGSWTRVDHRSRAPNVRAAW